MARFCSLRDLYLVVLPTPSQLAIKPEAANGPPNRYRVTQDTAKPRVESVDQEAESAKWRGLYQDLGLKAIAHKDGPSEISRGLNGCSSAATR
jgi:hypothetical protein